jgi:ABC-2 type transport system ATP-binding protein
MTYSGVGTSSHVFAQLIDNNTGLVVGDIVTPVPVTLDGQTHTVTVALEEVAQTMSPGDTLTLQLVGSATAYENFTSVGVIHVSTMQLTLPTAGAAADAAGPR